MIRKATIKDLDQLTALFDQYLLFIKNLRMLKNTNRILEKE